MKVSDKGLIEIVCSEGIVPYPYLDSVGVWTYGIGHTKGAGAPDPATMKRGIATPLKDCIELFRKDLVKYENAVLKAVKVPLKQHEFDALVHWHYNTGAIATATLTKRLNAGNRKAAADQFLVWNKPAELIPRRQKERKLFLDGVYSNNGKALVYTADSKGRLGDATSQNVAELLWLVPPVKAVPAPELPRATPLPVSPPAATPDPPPAIIVSDVPLPKPGLWSRFVSAFRKRTAA
ncbi:lysozyme [Boseaceae bacterium BT-24-1]|nr:lysozyme [Boseaceae bacterium BT-24-1]